MAEDAAISLEELARLAERAGLGRLAGEELAELRRYYDGLRPHLARLRAAVGPSDEPATVFLADRPTARR
jgi:hypothetical protein